MFVLLFAFVFGGAIRVPGGGSYREFLMGGIFAQTIVFGCFGVAMALAYDRTNGAIDRFHSLPIARSAVLAGHSLASLLRSLLPIVLMSITGLIIGWRIHGGAARRARRLRPDDRVLVRDDLGGHHARQRHEVARGRPGRGVRGDLPDHVHREHVRPHEHAARSR